MPSRATPPPAEVLRCVAYVNGKLPRVACREPAKAVYILQPGEPLKPGTFAAEEGVAEIPICDHHTKARRWLGKVAVGVRTLPDGTTYTRPPA